MYTRQWANNTGLPVFSIDYRLAPESPFPAALNDCWQVYYWLFLHAEEYLGIKAKRIYLAGESAGGNLIMGICSLAIEKGFYVPDLLLMAYPSLVITRRMFSPSLLLSIDDRMLPASFLALCIDSYDPDGYGDEEFLLSPALTPDHVLSHFPPTRIHLAGNDPLRDESYRLMLRMLRLQLDVHMCEFVHFPHAFWIFDLVKECDVAIHKVCEEFM